MPTGLIHTQSILPLRYLLNVNSLKTAAHTPIIYQGDAKVFQMIKTGNSTMMLHQFLLDGFSNGFGLGVDLEFFVDVADV
jgi:hypothetical protein